LASGFFLLVPLLITFLILRFAFLFLDGIFRGDDGLLNFVLKDKPWDIQGMGVVLSLVLLYIVGAFFAGKRSQAWQDAVLTKIPIIKTIYGVARQATKGLDTPMGHHYSRVVFVEWPRPGVKAMGFVTGHFANTQDGGRPLVAVYIPTVPNPTSGMLAFVMEEDIIETDISVQDAMKMVFSGGIVLPEMPANLKLTEPSQLGEDHSH
jgi:uncharacterized membrane protein